MNDVSCVLLGYILTLCHENQISPKLGSLNFKILFSGHISHFKNTGLSELYFFTKSKTITSVVNNYQRTAAQCFTSVSLQPLPQVRTHLELCWTFCCLIPDLNYRQNEDSRKEAGGPELKVSDTLLSGGLSIYHIKEWGVECSDNGCHNREKPMEQKADGNRRLNIEGERPRVGNSQFNVSYQELTFGVTQGAVLGPLLLTSCWNPERKDELMRM